MSRDRRPDYFRKGGGNTLLQFSGCVWTDDNPSLSLSRRGFSVITFRLSKLPVLFALRKTGVSEYQRRKVMHLLLWLGVSYTRPWFSLRMIRKADQGQVEKCNKQDWLSCFTLFQEDNALHSISLARVSESIRCSKEGQRSLAGFLSKFNGMLTDSLE